MHVQEVDLWFNTAALVYPKSGVYVTFFFGQIKCVPFLPPFLLHSTQFHKIKAFAESTLVSNPAAMSHAIEIIPTDTMSYLLAHVNATGLNALSAEFVPGTEDWPVLPLPAAMKPTVTATVPATYIYLSQPKTRQQGRARSLRV